ncbi:MAG TPA: 50S ribosomal protein L31e [Methanomicrobia archaeon]|nr:Ribosomal protein L31E [Candidatus Alkanophaga volatiphilum]HDO63708.1 50S ribosomal protein L31e [Methanomicrobia archaeon]HEX59301.1 50S ribosomal protein L31e [Methanomicrobia archaeon]
MEDGEERIYTIPLRREFLKAPRWRRSEKAVKAVKEFLKKHTKAEDVLIDSSVNEKIWERGAQKPPHKIRVKVKLEDGVAKVTLVE